LLNRNWNALRAKPASAVFAHPASFKIDNQSAPHTWLCLYTRQYKGWRLIMKVQETALAGMHSRPESINAEKAARVRQAAPDSPADRRIQSEEILNKIKDLTEDGMYSIRFELNKEADKLIINLVNKESGEIIRQIPPDELINASIKLRNYRGMIIESEG
jgi:flagellar protein FlaG